MKMFFLSIVVLVVATSFASAQPAPTPASVDAYPVAYAKAVSTGQYLVVGVGAATAPVGSGWLNTSATSTDLPKFAGSVVILVPWQGSLYIVGQPLTPTATAADVTKAIAAYQATLQPVGTGDSCGTGRVMIQGGCANGSCGVGLIRRH
jgi:hypothetical protein